MHKFQPISAISRGRVPCPNAVSLTESLTPSPYAYTTLTRHFHTSDPGLDESSRAPRTQRARTQHAGAEIAALSRATHPPRPQAPQVVRRVDLSLGGAQSRTSPSRRTPSSSARGTPSSSRPRRDVHPGQQPRTGANPLARGRGGASGSSSKQDDRDDQDPLEDPDKQPAMMLLEEHYANQFTNSPHDIAGHADVIEATDLARMDVNNALDVLKEAQASEDRVAIVDAEKKVAKAEEGITYALQLLAETKDKVYPVHEPGDIDMRKYFKDAIGNVANGGGGVGNTVEDSLRYLGGREGHEWRDPAVLARKVVRGEFVKFVSNREREEVEIKLKQLEVSRSTKKGGQGGELGVRFAPMDMQTRNVVASRLVAGRGTDLADKDLESPVERQAARLVNGMWPAQAKGTMLQTIRDHLPGAPSRGARSEPQRNTA